MPCPHLLGQFRLKKNCIAGGTGVTAKVKLLLRSLRRLFISQIDSHPLSAHYIEEGGCRVRSRAEML